MTNEVRRKALEALLDKKSAEYKEAAKFGVELILETVDEANEQFPSAGNWALSMAAVMVLERDGMAKQIIGPMGRN